MLAWTNPRPPLPPNGMQALLSAAVMFAPPALVGPKGAVHQQRKVDSRRARGVPPVGRHPPRTCIGPAQLVLASRMAGSRVARAVLLPRDGPASAPHARLPIPRHAVEPQGAVESIVSGMPRRPPPHAGVLMLLMLLPLGLMLVLISSMPWALGVARPCMLVPRHALGALPCWGPFSGEQVLPLREPPAGGYGAAWRGETHAHGGAHVRLPARQLPQAVGRPGRARPGDG